MFEQNEIFDLWCEKAFAQSLCIAAYEYFHKNYWTISNGGYYRKEDAPSKNYDNYKLALFIAHNKVNNKDWAPPSIKSEKMNPEYWIKEQNSYIEFKNKHKREPDGGEFFIPDFYYNILKYNEVIARMKHKPLQVKSA